MVSTGVFATLASSPIFMMRQEGGVDEYSV